MTEASSGGSPEASSPVPPQVHPELVAPWYRLGYVIPHLHTDMDGYQFARVAPDGMMLTTTQLNLADYSEAAVEAELPTLWDRLDVLARAAVDRVAISGVPLAAGLGRDRTQRLLAAATERSGRPCDTDLEAHIAAIRHLQVSEVALATRWPDTLNAAIVAYLGDAGIEVGAVCAESRDLATNKRSDPRADHELALRLGRRAFAAAPGAGALLLPGGLWFAVYAAPLLEQELGIPVLLNITSTTWAALRAYSGPLPHRPPRGFGQLLESL